jgi:AAA+ ATPase superfamily predicted ATPase
VDFLDREEELARLDELAASRGGLGALYGRRRVGKTRLLVEWARRWDGMYTVADASAPDVQRRYFAEALETRLPGFAEVTYADWRTFFARIAREASRVGWRGPLVIDELPYLVQRSPELPSVLQRWVDHDGSGMVLVVAGSSQHMMQGLVLSADAPLYGRARQVLELQPLAPRWLSTAFRTKPGVRLVELWSAWGGIPRYWELASGLTGTVATTVDRLVLDPRGPLHREPDRLIAEEVPPAAEVRAQLDAIGGGAHRVSEIAGRIGRPTTSLARPLQRLQDMGLVRREVPFGEHPRSTKRSLYRMADPFTRLWFRVVAPHRAQLATADTPGRRAILARHWPHLIGEAWEELCRSQLAHLSVRSALGKLGPWHSGMRWWRGTEPEWDVVARSVDGRRVLLGEVKVRAATWTAAIRSVSERPPPNVPEVRDLEIVRVAFVAAPPPGPPPAGAVRCVTAADLLK